MRPGPALFFLVAGCAKPATPPAQEPAVVVAPAPSAAPEPETRPEEQPRPAIEAVTGIAECDEYLELYRACEPKLAGDVAAGQRRAYPSERGWLLHLKSSSEAPGLPASCRDMLRELRPSCE